MSMAARDTARSWAKGKTPEALRAEIVKWEAAVVRQSREAADRVDFDDVRARCWTQTYLATLKVALIATEPVPTDRRCEWKYPRTCGEYASGRRSDGLLLCAGHMTACGGKAPW